MNYCTTIPLTKIPAISRIVVIGDIHGDWAALKSALKVAGVTNHRNEWTGGNTHLVQVGDLVDRANRSKPAVHVMDEKSEKRIISHLINLKRKAQEVYGDVHLLLGNHELMNVAGDFSYVSPMGLTDFNGKRMEQFKPGGKIARKLACNANAVIQIGSWIFSHAGITAQVSKNWTIDQVNTQIREYLLGLRDRPGPLMDLFWHRRYANEGACPLVQDALSHWKARNMAIGHTVQDGITSMCNGSLWKVDVGMSDAFGKCNGRERGSERDGACIEVLEILDDGKEINILKGRKQ
jgi:hypothetical protein